MNRIEYHDDLVEISPTHVRVKSYYLNGTDKIIGVPDIEWVRAKRASICNGNNRPDDLDGLLLVCLGQVRVAESHHESLVSEEFLDRRQIDPVHDQWLAKVWRRWSYPAIVDE